jgi:hypothetical protein
MGIWDWHHLWLSLSGTPDSRCRILPTLAVGYSRLSLSDTPDSRCRILPTLAVGYSRLSLSGTPNSRCREYPTKDDANPISPLRSTSFPQHLEFTAHIYIYSGIPTYSCEGKKEIHTRTPEPRAPMCIVYMNSI